MTLTRKQQIVAELQEILYHTEVARETVENLLHGVHLMEHRTTALKAEFAELTAQERRASFHVVGDEETYWSTGEDIG